ncbi:hypothetical protein GW17_00022354, partial [Ensete ventricosum]
PQCQVRLLRGGAPVVPGERVDGQEGAKAKSLVGKARQGELCEDEAVSTLPSIPAGHQGGSYGYRFKDASTGRYGAEVTHAILPGKARFSAAVDAPSTCKQGLEEDSELTQISTIALAFTNKYDWVDLLPRFAFP